MNISAHNGSAGFAIQIVGRCLEKSNGRECKETVRWTEQPTDTRSLQFGQRKHYSGYHSEVDSQFECEVIDIVAPIVADPRQFNSIPCRNKNEIVVYLIQSITKIIESSRVHSLISLKTILVILLKEIYVEQSNGVKSGLSEELKLAIVNCVEAALRRSTYEVVEQFYAKDNLILIAQMLSVCVELIKTETYRQLRYFRAIFYSHKIVIFN